MKELLPHLLFGMCFNTIFCQYMIPISWEIKPYAYRANNESKGVLFDILQKYDEYCSELKYERFSVAKDHFKNNYKKFVEFAESNFTQTYQNGSKKYIYLFPLFSPNLQLSEKNFVVKSYFHSPGAFVIVRQESISSNKKMTVGFVKTIPLLCLGVFTAASVGIIVWLWEKRSNADFKRKFPVGVLDGFWWALITMSTVGYGDMVPRSLFSRTISFIWVFVGLMSSAILTATVTDTLSDPNFIKIEGEKVAVLVYSAELQIAKQYNAVPLERDNYEEVLTALRNGDVNAALINSQIASWMQDEIRGGENDVKLSIVYEIQQEIPVGDVEYNYIKTKEKPWFNEICFKENIQEIVTETLASYYKHTVFDATYTPSLVETFHPKTGLGTYFILAVVVLVMVAGMEEFVYRQYRKKKESVEKDELELTQKQSSNFKIHVNNELLQLNRNFQEMKSILQGLEKRLQEK
ncbi:uncharacterized protein LOC130645087 [Hydractinia symbiolongicarpus]|uniref:uncharacterized protein LOC130645087 n=1 Tax=Hydractinia symbiolongicarpus TaxID=13093 RepID=UPI00254D53E0|nr:uncharacterized protein LOC130645087 [Hydractinia symbiolongicarpus]